MTDLGNAERFVLRFGGRQEARSGAEGEATGTHQEARSGAEGEATGTHQEARSGAEGEATGTHQEARSAGRASGPRLLWCAALGWLAWDGRRWARDGADVAARTAAAEVARAIQAEAGAIRGTNLDLVVDVKKKVPVMHSDRLAGWGRASEMAPRLAAMVQVAAPKLAVDPAALDADPFAINVNNGTLRIRRDDRGDGALTPHPGPSPTRGEGTIPAGPDIAADIEPNGYVSFAPHDPADLITKLAPVDYDPAAPRPEFDAFLAYVQPSPASRRFLAQWHGLSMTGDTSEQKLAMYWGKGRNGKSTLIDAVAHVLGDYSETVPIETFLTEGRGRTAGQATPDLAILPGVRFLRTSEPERGAKLAEALIKLVTGGEPILARHLNRDYFRFYPQFKLTISGNYRPEIRGSDEGIWRRMQLVPWTVIVPAERRDRALPEKLKAEASGILNWLLDGLADWLDNGLTVPAEVIEATDTYRAESDPLGRFLTACVTPEDGGRVQSSELHRLFLAWAKANGERDWSSTGFGRAMREKGYRSVNSHVIWWLDIRMVKSAADFDAGPTAPPDATPPPSDEDDYR